MKLLLLPPRNRGRMHVAPRAGARIETSTKRTRLSPVPASPPARGRGLKRVRLGTGTLALRRSPPARGRGLKLIQHQVCRITGIRSPPARGRGLKHHCVLCASSNQQRVAPRAGARIETPTSKSGYLTPQSPPARGRGLKLHVSYAAHAMNIVSPPARARIETGSDTTRCSTIASRPPRGGAD